MVTNSKEYMRAYQRARRAKIKTSCKENVKNVKSLDDLKPPKMVEKSGFPVEVDLNTHLESIPPISSDDSKTIDFSYLTNNSSFQRAIMEFIRRFVPGLENIKVRANKKVMKQSFNENANNYRNVMKELKQVLERRKK